MKQKDKAYEQHVKAQREDRPKEFGATPEHMFTEFDTEAYVRQWCAKNGLIHRPKRKKRK